MPVLRAFLGWMEREGGKIIIIIIVIINLDGECFGGKEILREDDENNFKGRD